MDVILRRGIRETNDGHFVRFWDKMTFLLGETFAYQHNAQSRECIVHALLASDACSFDSNLLYLALKLDPDWALQKDSNGNSPLHLAAAMAPPKIIKVMVEAGQRTDLESTALQPNCFGELPLFLAIKNNKKLNEGLQDMTSTAPGVMRKRDPKTRLFPFQLASCVSEEDNVDAGFQLLLLQPELVAP